MAVLLFAPGLAVLSTAVQPAAGAGSGYVPTSSLDDLADLGTLARLRDPRIRPLVIGPESATRAQEQTSPGAAWLCSGIPSGWSGPGRTLKDVRDT